MKGHTARLAVISEESGFAQDFVSGLRRLAPEAAVSVLEESFRSSGTDFRSSLSRLARKRPDAFLLLTQTDASLLRLVEQYRVLRLNLPIYSLFFGPTPTFLNAAGVKAEGIRVLDFLDLKEALAASGSDVYSRYKEQFGPLTSGKAMFVSVFEAFRALQLAIQSGSKPEDFLRNATFQGISGPWRFDETGFWAGPTLVMKLIKMGLQLLSQTPR